MLESIEILVVENHNMDSQKVFYCGNSELEAFKIYKKLAGGKRNIFKAKVYKKNFLGNPFIMKYEVIEVIK